MLGILRKLKHFSKFWVRYAKRKKKPRNWIWIKTRKIIHCSWYLPCKLLIWFITPNYIWSPEVHQELSLSTKPGFTLNTISCCIILKIILYVLWISNKIKLLHLHVVNFALISETVNNLSTTRNNHWVQNLLWTSEFF